MVHGLVWFGHRSFDLDMVFNLLKPRVMFVTQIPTDSVFKLRNNQLAAVAHQRIHHQRPTGRSSQAEDTRANSAETLWQKLYATSPCFPPPCGITILEPCTLLHQELESMLKQSGKISPSLLEYLHHLRLRYLKLAYCAFYGPIPHQFSNLSNLWHLDLGYNYWLYSENLKWLSHLSLLSHLDLSYVVLSKATGWVQSISNLPLLKELHLYQCYPPDITHSSPFRFNSSVSLSFVDLSSNGLSSSIYNWLFNFSSSLAYLDLRYNVLKGSIPDAFEDLISLTNLSLRGNQLEGGLPKSFANSSHLQSLDLSGPIPLVPSNLSSLILSKNKFGGPLSFLCAITGDWVAFLEPLEKHFDWKNHPRDRSDEMLESLDLSANKLSGEISRSLAHLNFLSVLNLSSNNLSGEIPLSTQLQSFNASAYPGNRNLCGLPLPNKCLGDTPIAPQPKEDEDRSITQGFYISMGLGLFFGFWGVFGTILFNSRS
ncbi:hypothetical protein RHSIM_Rhsim05G0176400 [Rhododendron simsii]|uniref:Uncharacterized protein n=1 Tax=Rhododendron simsii TaxID=118357 RepID=A0A834H9R3_RHOSS|nr:hypothetical protein RHSIM_Rhsim05G0176400 [Rhododendron simsii]